MVIPCKTSSCTVPDLKEDIVEVKRDMKELMHQYGTILAIHRDVRYLSESVRQLREDSKDISNRLFEIEGEEHHKEIKYELQSKITKRGLITFLTISTGVLTLIFLVVQVIVSIYFGKH